MDPAPNERPPVRSPTHRHRRRRRTLVRWTWRFAWGVVVLSVILAIFVHKGLLGIAGLVSAGIVALYMLDPRRWPLRDDTDDVMGESSGSPDRSASPPR